jgi:predicted nucleic acid-binding protein
MPGKVVDASVLGAAAFQEPRFAETVALLQGFELYAPTLLAYELASIARKKALLYPAFVQDLVMNLSDALAMDIHWMEVNHRDVVELALATGLTTYDASYLYLARALGVPMVTFDQRLQRAAQGPGG